MRRMYGLIVILIGALYFFYDSVLIVFPSAVINDLMFKFSVGATGVGAFSAIYFYFYAPLQIFNGILISNFGPKRIIILGIAICILGLFLFKFSDNYTVGCFSRALMGIGASAGYIAPMMLAVNWFDKKYYVILTGFIVFVECIGAGFGQTGLIILTKLFSLQNTISILIILGVLICGLTLLIVKDYPIDRPVHVNKPKKFNWNEFLHIVTDIYFIKMAFCATMLWAPISIFASLWGINFMHEVYNISNLTAAHLLILIWCGVGFGGPLSGLIANIVKSKLGVMLLFTVFGCVASLLLVFVVSISKLELGALLFFIGLASSAQVLIFGMVFDKIGNRKSAVVFGFNNMFICFGSAISQGFASFLLDVNWRGKISHGIHIYSVENYKHMALIMPVCYLSVILICSTYWIRKSRSNPTTSILS
jgi:MFS family permease